MSPAVRHLARALLLFVVGSHGCRIGLCSGGFDSMSEGSEVPRTILLPHTGRPHDPCRRHMQRNGTTATAADSDVKTTPDTSPSPRTKTPVPEVAVIPTAAVPSNKPTRPRARR